jgi:hypothetical protein
MKEFILKIGIFVFVLVAFGFLVVLTPATPRSKNNYLASKSMKDSLLSHVKEPRVIFIGGSNLIYGLNSQLIKDSLGVNPINSGLSINLGLVYMLDAVSPYIKEGDLVILCPEYQLYFSRYGYGLPDFFRYLKDNDPNGFKILRAKHVPNLFIKGMPRYAKSKFDYRNYVYDETKDIHGKHVINDFGDSDYHWNLEHRNFNLILPIKDNVNFEMIKEIKRFESFVNDKGGELMISFPGIQESSYEVIQQKVNEIYTILQKEGFTLLGSPQRYIMPDSLMFDSPYHLLKEGVDRRTNNVIEDIKSSKTLTVH